MLKPSYKKHQRSFQQFLGPWQTANNSFDEENQMNQYCHKLLPSIQKNDIKEKLSKQFYERIQHNKRRPTSNAALSECRGKQNRLTKRGERALSIHRIAEKACNQDKDFFQLNFNLKNSKANKNQNMMKNQSKIQLHYNKNSNRTLRSQKRSGACLQQIQVQNFLIEGTRELQRDPNKGKRESAFVMKHKFAQIRKSMNFSTSQNLSSYHQTLNQNKFPRSSCQNQGMKQDKQNLILKLIRYEQNG